MASIEKGIASLSIDISALHHDIDALLVNSPEELLQIVTGAIKYIAQPTYEFNEQKISGIVAIIEAVKISLERIVKSQENIVDIEIILQQTVMERYFAVDSDVTTKNSVLDAYNRDANIGQKIEALLQANQEVVGERAKAIAEQVCISTLNGTLLARISNAKMSFEATKEIFMEQMPLLAAQIDVFYNAVKQRNIDALTKIDIDLQLAPLSPRSKMQKLQTSIDAAILGQERDHMLIAFDEAQIDATYGEKAYGSAIPTLLPTDATPDTVEKALKLCKALSIDTIVTTDIVEFFQQDPKELINTTNIVIRMLKDSNFIFTKGATLGIVTTVGALQYTVPGLQNLHKCLYEAGRKLQSHVGACLARRHVMFNADMTKYFSPSYFYVDTRVLQDKIKASTLEYDSNVYDSTEEELQQIQKKTIELYMGVIQAMKERAQALIAVPNLHRENRVFRNVLKEEQRNVDAITKVYLEQMIKKDMLSAKNPLPTDQDYMALVEARKKQKFDAMKVSLNISKQSNARPILYSKGAIAVDSSLALRQDSLQQAKDNAASGILRFTQPDAEITATAAKDDTAADAVTDTADVAKKHCKM